MPIRRLRTVHGEGRSVSTATARARSPPEAATARRRRYSRRTATGDQGECGESVGKFGGAEGSRTPDPKTASLVLSQLSYSPTRETTLQAAAERCQGLGPAPPGRGERFDGESRDGSLSHVDCKRPHALTAEERALLFVYCSDHGVAHCLGCDIRFRMSELAADPLSGRTNLHPRCHRDLTESARARVVSGVLLAVGMTGCAANVTPPMMSADQPCERDGGAWHSASEICAHDSPNAHEH